jgi:hypothetical protein
MRRVLIVSPHFCPVNAPDMQRARIMLPQLRAHGWEPVVLALTPDTVEGAVIEPALEETYPDDIRVVRVRGLPPRLTRRFGFGGLWLRAGRALRRAGERLLAAEKFDLVFFTTTQFDAFTLGPRWLARFGVPYVLDYQDPWVTDHYARTGQQPPGGPLRFAISQWRARRREPEILERSAGIVSVSPAYLTDLSARCPSVTAKPSAVLPFGASPADLDIARGRPPARPLVPFGDGCIHFVYTGRGGDDLRPALGLLFSALAEFRERDPHTAGKLRLHFIGTSYAPPPLGRETILPVAREHGVADLVRETCHRVPYLEALHYLSRADAILAVGSDDPSYNASKLAPCLLAGRPLLAIFHANSPAHGFLARHAPGARRVAFDPASSRNHASREDLATWFDKAGWSQSPQVSLPSLDPMLASAMTARLAALFDLSLRSEHFTS